MRVAVWDRFWSTLGGGERFAAGIAAELTTAGHEVTLLTPEPIDVAAIGEHLQIDLEGTIGVLVEQRTPDALEAASAPYDLLVNASFTSAERCGARHGIYVVHFPQLAVADAPLTRLLRPLGRAIGAAPAARSVHGVFPPEPRRTHNHRWTGGLGQVRLELEAGDHIVSIHLSRSTPDRTEIPVELVHEGRVVGSGSLVPPRHRLDRRATATLDARVSLERSGPVTLEVRSPTFAEPGTEARTLGVPFVGASRGWRRWPSRLIPAATEPDDRLEFLTTYDRVLSNSEYTRTWTRRDWSIETGLLHPPVGLRARGPKEPMIISVGRFIEPGDGHNKKQLELVEAFAQLVREGLDGWRLVLLGGSAGSGDYLARVRRAAEGLPVEVLANASASELARHYGAASIYWHATGLGEDPARHPDRFEHFGITTVEAMSAGAVPVVIGAAGQLEIVEDGVSGVFFDDLDGLARATRELVSDPGRLETMSQAAEAASARFGPDAFRRRLLEEVDTVLAG